MSEMGHEKAIWITRGTSIELPISCHMPQDLQGFRQMTPIALRHGVKIHL